MKCPVCGAAALVHDARDMTSVYKGESVVIPAVQADWCPACGEALMGPDESERVMQAIRAFQQRVNAALVDPVFILSVRKKLKLDQREASELFGGGVNAFSRYETGKTRPPLALVQLFRLLDRHPDLLDEVRRAG